jgi:hypothetical protein
MSSSMCKATLLPEPDRPLTMIRRMHGPRVACPKVPKARLDHLVGMMIAGFFLVLLDAAIELVGERIDGGVHVAVGRVGVDLIAAQHQRGLRLVAQLFDGENAVDVDQLLEMPEIFSNFLDT